ncbi:MAG: CD1108 family mobile element protein [Hominisplanchenecus sp.]
MAEQKMKARDKKVQKMTRDGLEEKNLVDRSSVRVSKRAKDVKLYRNRNPDEEEGTFQKKINEKSDGLQTTRTGKQTRGEKGIKGKSGSSKRQYRELLSEKNGQASGEGKLQTGKADGYGARLYEKKAELSQSRGDSRKASNGGAKKPKQKRRLQFTYDETGAAETEKTENRQGRNAVKNPEEPDFKEELQGTKAKQQKQKVPRKHSGREKVYQEETAVGGKIRRLRFSAEESAAVSQPPSIRKKEVPPANKALTAGVAAVHREVGKYEDENAAVEGTNRLLEGGENGYHLTKRSVRAQNRRNDRRAQRLRTNADKAEIKLLYEKALSEDEKLKNSNHLKKMIQKKRIKKEYAKAKQAEQSMGTATVGTIDYIKKIGGKVTDFFKENRKLYISIGVLIGLMLLIMASVTSCSAMFLQNTVDYAGVSYMSTDEAIREADLYYTKLEAQLQERINNMESEEPGHEEYRYNIGPIEHDPFVLISYLSAKYEIFTFEEVKPELDDLFARQYHLQTEAVNERVTETRMVRVGESLGQVVTSGYCNCPICCGIWSGGPTASGVYPTANHTIAVDASDPFVPMGTKVVMNGVEYTVEDTGAFARYGVQFDVYYDSHSAASAHGHQTWEAYIADDNGSQEVEVTSTRDVDTLNVTLENRSLLAICQDRLSIFKRDLFSTYNETKGNLQMFASPFEFNWYGRVSSYYGYRIHPITGENQMHNGIDIGVPAGTSVKAGLTGTVTVSSYNDSYGNYVIIKDSDGYELRYAHLESRSVSAGASVIKGEEIGLAGSTGNSTGSHLHVELLKDGERLNPIFYLETGSGTIFGGNEYTSEAAQRLLEEADRYLGVPYVWGGYSPSGFDCSGFVSYCLTNSGVRNTGRLTAQGLYNICTPVPESEVQPGDLIFFTGTYNAGEPVTHIGIYVGNGQMIHCGHPVQYTSIYSSYWQSHFYGFGRW